MLSHTLFLSCALLLSRLTKSSDHQKEHCYKKACEIGYSHISLLANSLRPYEQVYAFHGPDGLFPALSAKIYQRSIRTLPNVWSRALF
jgi:hypothetical protein